MLYMDLQSRLQFELIYLLGEKNWGMKQNRTYNGVLGSILRNTTDTGVGFFHIKMGETKDFDITAPFWYDSYVWYVPIAKKFSNWENIIRIFSNTVWLTIASVLMLLILVFYISQKLLLQKQENVFIKSALNAFRLVLEVPFTRFPNIFSYKLVYLCALYYFLIIDSLFNGNFIAALTKDIYHHQITTLEEIVDSGLVLGMHPHTAKLYSISNHPYYQYIANNYVACDMSYACGNRSAFKRDMAFTTPKIQMTFRIPQYYLDKDGKSLIYTTNTAAYSIRVAWYFRKGFPMFQQINNLIHLFESSGVKQHHFAVMQHFYKSIHNAEVSRFTHLEVQALTFQLVKYLLAVLGIGLVISLFVFLVEIFGKLPRKGFKSNKKLSTKRVIYAFEDTDEYI